MGKNVAVFVDVANIFYAAKAAGVDIDYVTLLRSATAGRDLVRAYAYTGLDPENENQRNFHSFLARNGFRVVSKDIRKYGDGKVKANLDIELVVDMMKTARNLDVAIVVSGDGDFAPAIRAVQEMGVRVEVISFKGNTSSDLIDVADLFSDITQLAKVEKGTRSGRRVAESDDDLSMTEVPDKQSEGAARGRGRGRGRTKVTEAEAAPAARGRRVTRTAVAAAEPAETAATAVGGAGVVALPGEKLSRAARPAARPAPAPAAAAVPHSEDEEGGEGGHGGELDGEGRRRRRRRGGRGRGRGRGREGGLVGTGTGEGDAHEADEADYEEPSGAPAAPRAAAFGSFWDSQLGVPPTPSRTAPVDEEYEDEPEIPEYLIAEQRRPGGRGGSGGGAGRGQGAGRGGRGGAYAAATARERFGRGGGGGGINRYPDVSGRDRGAVREERGGDDRRGGRGGEPWSEVPPELARMLLAQVGAKAGPKPASRPATGGSAAPEAAAKKPATRSRAKAPEPAGSSAAPEAAAKKPATRSRAKAPEPAGSSAAPEAAA
ncbi:MAG: hypothetical protein RL338_764, partial [Chloroflexota bacterium]